MLDLRRNKWFYLSVTSVVSVSLLAGCGVKGAEGGAAAPESKEITVLYLDEPFWKQQNEEFTQATGIKVKYETVPFTQLHDKVLTAFTGGSSAYDVIHVRDDWATEFASKGFIVPLESYVTDEMKKRFNPQTVEALSYKGNMYGIPRYVWLWQFYYNKKLFQQAGVQEPPKTWDELLSVAQKLGKNNITPLAETWGGSLPYSSFIVHLRANGGQFWDEQSNRPAFNSPEGIAALQLMIDMNQKYKVMSPQAMEFSSSSAMTEVFTQGGFAMNMNTPQVYPMSNDAAKSKVVGDIGVALIPGAKLKTASYGETGGLAIPASSKKKDWAAEYIKFVTTAEQQKKMTMMTGKIPSDTAVVNDPEIQAKYPNFKLIPEQMMYPFTLFKHEQAVKITDELSRHLAAALTGKVAAEQALKDAEAKISAMLSK